MATPHNAIMIANWFVTRARENGKVLSVMTILKPCYIAHGGHLEIMEGPLFWNRVEAWRYGPVIRNGTVAKLQNPCSI